MTDSSVSHDVDPRADYWFEPPFHRFTDERRNIHVMDSENRLVLTFYGASKLPESEKEEQMFKDIKQRWTDFADWLVERMNS